MTDVSEFIGYIQHEKRYSLNTVQAYTRDLEQFFLYLQLNYEIQSSSNISHLQIRSWLASLKEDEIQSKSINRKISTLKSFFKYLLKKKKIDSSPMTKIISPKNAKRLPVFVNETNMDTLLTEVEFPDDFNGFTERLIIELLYQTGMRRAELIGLQISSLQLSQKAIKVLGKGNKERILPLLPELIELIQNYLIARNQFTEIDHNHLLVLKNGRPIYPKFVYLVVKKYLSVATTLNKKSPHVLRHTFATHLLNKGADLNAVKELLGHANLTATQIYTHNTIDKLKEIHKKAHPKA
ncbi:MAG TPA: tyrosine-type recombinase/integrase [Chitinophagaceae bacterium]|nr:tyrosine-type recombinase/integrase [Chitinophagaceae bacterium]